MLRQLASRLSSSLGVPSRLLTRSRSFTALSHATTTATSVLTRSPLINTLSVAHPRPPTRIPTPLLSLLPTRGFRVRNAIKKKCEHCTIKRKKNKKWYVYCKANPRHKQRQL